MSVECAACHVDIRAHGHDALAPHPAYAENRDGSVARAEFCRGIVGCAQMEGIGTECAVRSRNFGRNEPCIPRRVTRLLNPSAVFDGGMVHRHIDAADAYALGMGFQRIGFLRVNGDVFSSGDVGSFDVICTVLRIIQRDTHIAIVFHAGKSSGDIQRGDAHAEDIGSVFALVRCVDGDIFRTYGIGNFAAPFRQADSTARDIDIRTAPVDDAGVADAHTAKRAYSDRSHAHLGAVTLLRLQGVDVDVLARDSRIGKGYVRVVVGMDDGIRNVHGCSAGRSDTYIFRGYVAGVLGGYIDIVTRCQGRAVSYGGMDALLPGIGGRRIVCRRVKVNTHIFECFEVFHIIIVHAVELCAVSAKSTLHFIDAAYMYVLPLVVLRVKPVQVLSNLILGGGTNFDFPIFILGVRKLGFRDALVDGGDRHVDVHADAAGSHARHLAVKAALFFRFHVNIIRCFDRSVGHVGADAAVDVVQGHSYPDAADTAGTDAAGSTCRQLVRSVYIDIVGFQIAIGHQRRCLACGVVDAHIGSQSRAEAGAQAGRDQCIFPVVLVLRQYRNILAASGALRLQDAVRNFRLDGGCVVHDRHAGACRHCDHAGGYSCCDILRMAVAKVFRLNFRLAVKVRIHFVQLCADRACVLMPHDAVAGGHAYFSASCSSRKGQGGGTVLGRGVHGEVLSVHILFRTRGRGGNLRYRLPVIGLPVCGHAKRNSQRCPGAHSGCAGERTEVGIVYGVHIYIGSISVGIEVDVGILDFGCSRTGLIC